VVREREKGKVRVLIVDDHFLFRQGVIHTLSQEVDIAVAGEASSVAQVLEKARNLLPDVILLDIKLPDGSGLQAVARLQQECPYSKVVMLTVFEDEDVLLEALKEGAQGYLVKGISGEELVESIRAVHRGETFITPTMAGRLLSELIQPGSNRSLRGLGELTEREREILEQVARGRTNREIATQLYLSEKTIKHYMTNILQKLQVRNRVEAALLATREGIG